MFFNNQPILNGMELTDAVGYAVIIIVIPLTIALAAWVIMTAGDTLLPTASNNDKPQ